MKFAYVPICFEDEKSGEENDNDAHDRAANPATKQKGFMIYRFALDADHRSRPGANRCDLKRPQMTANDRDNVDMASTASRKGATEMTEIGWILVPI